MKIHGDDCSCKCCYGRNSDQLQPDESLCNSGHEKTVELTSGREKGGLG